MTNFTWKINNLQVLQSPEPNTVVMSNFTIIGKDDELTGSVTYAVNLLPANQSKFIPFDQITEDQVIQWTQDALGEFRVTAMQEEVQQQIDAQKIPPPQNEPLPWSN